MSENLVSSAIECANELISGLSCVHCSDVRFVMESSPIIQKHLDAYSKAQNERLAKELGQESKRLEWVMQHPMVYHHNHVHAALMGMSDEEWWEFNDLLSHRLKLEEVICFSPSMLEQALKAPLFTLVSCYIEATKGRTKP